MFESGERFLEAMEDSWEGVVVLDVRMGAMSGLDVFGKLRERGSELMIIFLSGHGDIAMAVGAVKQGAFDFLEKPCAERTLLDKLDDALSVALARRQSRGSQEAAQARLTKLSQREREVMERILAGKLNKQIADELGVAVRTIEVHRANVFAKMAVRSAVELSQLLAGWERG